MWWTSFNMVDSPPENQALILRIFYKLSSSLRVRTYEAFRSRNAVDVRNINRWLMLTEAHLETVESPEIAQRYC